MVFGGFAGLVLFFLWVYAIIDVISTDESVMRNLPKLVWLIIVIFVPVVGPLLWLILGRPQGVSFRPGGENSSSEYRPRHPPAPRPQAPKGPEDSPEFLGQIDDTAKRLREWEADLRRREEELRRRDDEGREP